jgi:DNA mismatch endonuclease, patch repair protein
MDPLTPEQRSYTMGRVHGKNTKPELLVRRLLYKLGYRYRLQGRDLPGNPDIVFRSKKKVIFIHGCFWHGHECKAGSKRPKTNEGYWLPKLAKTRARDAQNQEKLLALGWDFLILWECELKNNEALTEKIRKFMGGKGHD